MSVNGRFDADVADQQSAIQFGAIEFPFNDGAILWNSEATTKSKRTVISRDKEKYGCCSPLPRLGKTRPAWAAASRSLAHTEDTTLTTLTARPRKNARSH